MLPAESIPTILVSDVPDDVHVLDVREQDEWDAGHVEGSQHIPLGELVQRAGEVPQDRRVVVVCRSGGRSAQATAYLAAGGWEAVNLHGGLQAWAAAGRPLACDGDRPPAVA